MKFLRILTLVIMSALGVLQTHSAAAQLFTTITRDAYEHELLQKRLGKPGIGISFVWVKQVGSSGLTISEVAEGSPAFKAGLQIGDRITAIEGKIILGMEEEIASKLLRADTGLPQRFTYVRDGVYKDVALTREDGLLGIGFANATPSFYARIEQVLKGLPAQRAGLMEGDLLLAVDNMTLARFGNSDELQSYLSQGELGSPVTLTISRNMEVFQIKMLRDIVPNVYAKYGVQIFASRLRTSRFATHDWAELSLWNLDWVDLLNPDLKNFEGKKYNALDEALLRLSDEKYVVWNLQNNVWANDPEQTARITARFMKSDGWVLSYKDDSTGALTTYRRNGSVLSKEVKIGGKTETSVVEQELTTFDAKLVILVNDKTESGAVALAYALRLSKSALVVGQQPFGSTRITRNVNLQPNLYEKMVVGSYRMENGGGIGVSVDITIDSLSSFNTTTAFKLLVKPDLQWWENEESLANITFNVIGGIVLFSFICIAVLFTPKSNGFPGLRLRNVAFGFLVVEVTVIAAVAFVVMLTQMFWPTMIVFTLAVGVMVGRSMPSK
ncbi:MAG: PDZ domain-containing protein [Candidatus Melainabacteria bacterium]|nr:MAG: PDZ domain-containing protein [Candidatus Melainabacteria bacterium]